MFNGYQCNRSKATATIIIPSRLNVQGGVHHPVNGDTTKQQHFVHDSTVMAESDIHTHNNNILMVFDYDSVRRVLFLTNFD